MMSSRKLMQMAKRWAKAAGIRRKRISLRQTDGATTSSSSACSATPASRGHFVVYTNDQKRFEVPLAWLRSDIVMELLRMAEEEFGLPGDGPITLPCDAAFMMVVLESLKRCVTMDLERLLQSSIAGWRCSGSSSLARHQTNQQLFVC